MLLESDFLVLCDSLPKIELPFELYCEECCLHPDLSSLQSKIIDYLPEGSSFLGIIEVNEDYVSILVTYAADWSIPAVIVFTSNGYIIDKEVFLGGYCGSDYGFLSKQYLFINSSTELLEIDSLLHLTYEEETFEIKDTIKLEIETKAFNIDRNGIKKSL